MEPKTVRRANGAQSRRQNACDITNAIPAGTQVLTLDGAMPVEFLSPGDRVITRDSGMAVLAAVHSHEVTLDCVSIRAGSLGNTRPDRDVILPAGQRVLIRDWRAQALFGKAQALVPTARLADGEFIRPVGPREMTVIELVFDTPHIVYADGLELASAEPARSDAALQTA